MHRITAIIGLIALTACGGGAGSSSAPEIPSGLNSPKLYLFHRLGGIDGIQKLKKKPVAQGDPTSVDRYWKCGLKAVGKKLSNAILEQLTAEYTARENLIAGEINRPAYKQIISDVTGFKSAMTNREKTYLAAIEGSLKRCTQEFEQG